MKKVRITETASKGRGVVSDEAISKDELVIIGKPIGPALTRTMTSLQTGWESHVELDEPACVVNHSCEPNLGIRNNTLGGYSFYALSDISAGTELTYDYNTSDYISISVSACACGAKTCRGKTSGFKFLQEELRSKYGEYLADYLKVSR